MAITFGQLESALEDEAYPLTAEELRDDYGDMRLAVTNGGERADGAESVGAVLDRVEVEEFRNPREVLEAIATGVGVEGVGRVGYSDRGSSLGEEDGRSF